MRPRSALGSSWRRPGLGSTLVGGADLCAVSMHAADENIATLCT